MTTRRVTTPSGVAWSVRRRWLPHREGKGVRARWSKRRKVGDLDGGLDAADALGGCGDDLAAFGIAVAAVVVLVILLLIGGPLLLIGVDLLWLLVIGGLGLLGRVVLRRPWRVEAVSGVERRSWLVPGFGNAGRHRDEIARQLQHGQNPLGTAATEVSH